MRGLKQVTNEDPTATVGVAPFTGAWIETKESELPSFINRVAPFTGAWIETDNYGVELKDLIGRTLYGCVD